MNKLWGDLMKMEVADLLDYVLKVQTESYGRIEIQHLTHFIKEHHIKNVLDIGTGQGMFLLALAKELPEVQFLGIDQNKDFIHRAEHQKNIIKANNVHFVEATFNSDYAHERYDFILSRYCLQHTPTPQKFIAEIYKRLQHNGAYLTIDEYLFEPNIDDETWREFYKRWIECFALAGANPFIHRNLTTWLNQTGFKRIENKIQLYSPATIGTDAFKTFTMCIVAAFCRIYPQVMPESLAEQLDAWFKSEVLSKKVDPHLQVAYAVAFKN